MTEQFRPRGFSILPVVVKNLLILNILIYIAQWVAKSRFDINLEDSLGLHYPGSMAFNPWQFVTYMFLHSTVNIWHLVFNMFALWMFGYALENIWGPRRFLIYYFITGIGAATVHYLILYLFEIKPIITTIDAIIADPNYLALNNFLSLDPQQIQMYLRHLYSEPQKFSDALDISRNFLVDYREYFLNQPNVIGASGAVFGILLAFGMLFPNTLIYIYFFFPIKAKYFVIGYGLIELFSGLSGAQSNVAHFAHLGGMVFGFFLILYWKKKGRLY
jgi:membrane associated rhomboid family serine protease